MFSVRTSKRLQFPSQSLHFLSVCRHQTKDLNILLFCTDFIADLLSIVGAAVGSGHWTSNPGVARLMPSHETPESDIAFHSATLTS